MKLSTKLLNAASDAPVVLICGPMCSGKSTLSKALAAKLNYAHIPVSKIVASIINSNDRQSLQDTTDLTDDICEMLDNQITDAIDQYGGVLVDGIRQPDILEYLIVLFGIERITMIWIDPGLEERRTRWNIRAATKDAGSSFEQIDQRDFDMGLGKIKLWIDRINILTTND